MSILFNGNSNPTAIKYNGNDVYEVVFNNNTVWEAGNWVNVAQGLSDSYLEGNLTGTVTKTYTLPAANPIAIRITGAYAASIYDQSGNFVRSNVIAPYSQQLLPISNDSNNLIYAISGLTLSVTGGYSGILSGGYYVFRLYYVSSIDALYS